MKKSQQKREREKKKGRLEEQVRPCDKRPTDQQTADGQFGAATTGKVRRMKKIAIRKGEKLALLVQ